MVLGEIVEKKRIVGLLTTLVIG